MADKGRSLAQAVATSLFLLGLVIACYLLGRAAFFVLAAAVILFAFFELMDAAPRKGRGPHIVFGLACCFALMLAAYLHRPDWLLAVAAATPAGCLLLSLQPGHTATAADDAAWTVLGVAWIGGGGAAAVSILVLPGEGLKLLILFMLAAAADDISAYFVGTAFGRHRLAPSISPSKTWEGFAGGVAGALVVAAILIPLWTTLGVAQALAVGAIVAVLAPLGDLAESLVKRELGVKDSGRLLPGHGGMLDRLDAIIFCAPAVFLLLHFMVS
ncbi:MAG: phosphatidate cytidylyltransferase [Actinomycetota bacterium]|nr:phosphatidate cytidylyltransferase [Actinomycetota bacterium]